MILNRLVILGDSTASIKRDSARPETGWGEAFSKYLKPGWLLDNRAINGRSTKDVISRGEFGAALDSVTAGDIVLMQYGHNDEKLADPDRGAPAWHEYAVNLVYMAGKFKEKGARVIFLTSIARRNFIDGSLQDTHGDWPAAMKYAASLSGVDCIDMTIPTMVGIVEKGEEESKAYFMNFPANLYDNYPDGKDDNTHLRPEGAEWVAKMVYDKLSMLDNKPECLI